jgi:hypothetical protein
VAQRRWSAVAAAWLAACALPEYATFDAGAVGSGGIHGGGSAGEGAAAGDASSGAAGGAGGNGGGGASGGSGGAAPCPPLGGAEVIACDRTKPVAVAVDNVNVYWVDEGDGRVMFAPKAGGAAVVVASGQGQPCGVAAVGGHVYWRTRGGVVRRKEMPSGALQDLAVGQGNACAVDADATAAFWIAAEGAAFAVMMAAPPGASPKKIASAMSAGDLDAQGGGVVGWTDPSAGKAYTSPKVLGDEKTQIATGAVHGIAFHGPDYYISIESGGIVSGQTGNAEQAFASGLSSPTGITVWNQEVLWIEQGNDRVARKDVGSPLAAPPTVLVADVPVCGSIAADAAHVYWPTCDDGRVMRAPHAEMIVVRH